MRDGRSARGARFSWAPLAAADGRCGRGERGNAGGESGLACADARRHTVSVQDEVEPSASAPREGTLERWAWDYVLSTELSRKRAPGPAPLARDESFVATRAIRPGRPATWVRATRKDKTPRPGALADPKKRAALLHVFAHHELQAAELFAWAMLAFADAPDAFVRGLASLLRDEARHFAMYEAHLATLGVPFGSLPIRDWFWERVPSAKDAASYCALVGLGFEAGNLDHTARFASAFRAAGDPKAADITERIGGEEVAHVRFAVRWFRALGGTLDFASFERALPPPLTPLVMRGKPLDRTRRLEAGFPADMIDALDAWQPAEPAARATR